MSGRHELTLLVVEDDPVFIRFLEKILSYQNIAFFSVRFVSRLETALELLKTSLFDAVLLDLGLPDSNGIETFQRFHRQWPEVPVIVLSNLDDQDIACGAVSQGAQDYLVKGEVDGRLLSRSILYAVQRRRLQKALEVSLENLRRARANTIQLVAMAVEMRDPFTAGHQQRVTKLAAEIAKIMQLHPDIIEGLIMAGLIHDMGKIFVPAEILSKPGKLNDIMISLIRTHPQIAYDLLQTLEFEFPWPVAEIILQHHEHIDGSGYPRGLTGKDIRLESKIITVADVVEAISSHRPYRPSLGIDYALNEIKNYQGIHYDSEIVEICLTLFREKGFVF